MPERSENVFSSVLTTSSGSDLGELNAGSRIDRVWKREDQILWILILMVQRPSRISYSFLLDYITCACVRKALATNTEPKPTAAFTLSLLAGLFTLIGAFLTTAMAPIQIPGINASIVLVLGSIAGILVILGSWLLYSNDAQRRIGSILVISFSIISFNFVGLILGLVGGFLGLTHESTSSRAPSRSSSGRSFNPP